MSTFYGTPVPIPVLESCPIQDGGQTGRSGLTLLPASLRSIPGTFSFIIFPQAVEAATTCHFSKKLPEGLDMPCASHFLVVLCFVWVPIRGEPGVLEPSDSNLGREKSLCPYLAPHYHCSVDSEYEEHGLGVSGCYSPRL